MASLGIKRVAAFFLSICLCVLVYAFDGEQRFADIAEGDLLFILPAAPNDITITTGTADLAADHVAICHRIGGQRGPLYLIEAIPSAGVTLTPVDSLLSREPDVTLLVGSVAGLNTAASVEHALRFIGRPYDHLFLPSDSAIYCSELVQRTFVDTGGAAVFPTIPMSFHDATGRVTDNWRQHYARHGLDVPEGQPGTNPTQLATHPAVTLRPLRP